MSTSLIWISLWRRRAALQRERERERRSQFSFHSAFHFAASNLKERTQLKQTTTQSVETHPLYLTRFAPPATLLLAVFPSCFPQAPLSSLLLSLLLLSSASATRTTDSPLPAELLSTSTLSTVPNCSDLTGALGGGDDALPVAGTVDDGAVDAVV